MPNRSDRHLLLVAIDMATAVLAFVVAVRLRFGPDFVMIWEDAIGMPSIFRSAASLAVGAAVVFAIGGAYRTERFWSLRSEIGALLGATAIGALVLMSALYFFRFEDFSRLTLGGFLVLTFAGTAATRVLLKRSDRASDAGVRVVFAGTDGADRILPRLKRLPGGPAQVVGFVGRETAGLEAERLGDLEHLPQVLAKHIVDEVIVCLPVEEWGRLDAIAGVCEEQGKAMRVPVDVVGYSLRRGRIEDLDTVPMLSLVSSPSGNVALVAKRAIDFLVSAVLVIALMPVHLIISAALLATQGRPVLFRQERSGLNGRPFSVLKYRTMRTDAEETKHELMDRNERIGPAFKVTDDPRVTGLGRILRKTSIDEFPQLWNVLMGDMSLVGPRPQPIAEVAEYDPWHRRRLTVRPGITGLWQVTSRHDPSFDRWVDLDLEYIDRWSVWLDLKILAQTPLALVRSPGE